MDLGAGVAQGDRRALARALTLVENRGPGFRDLLRALAPKAGRAHRVGVTGAPGAGKSTLTSALARAFRKDGRTVAVLAVDPSSPFTGGALLGDRIRMTGHLGDEGVFVRSMASRGAEGGLAAAAGDALDVLDAAGFDVLLVETVGAGQADLEIARAAETVLVVFAPGAGDGIQAMKSGLMEIATFRVVNKADDPAALAVRNDLVAALGLSATGAGAGAETPEDRVFLVSAKTEDGVDGLAAAVDAHFRVLASSGTRAGLRRAHLLRRIESAVRDALAPALAAESPRVRALVDGIVAGRRTVHGAAEEVLRDEVRRLDSSGGGGGP